MISFYIISPEIYAWVILPILIFLARICDVSMETIRVIYISRGIKLLAPIIAFFEIVIWLLAIEVVMSNLSNIANFMAFAFGFACGTYVGLIIEEKLSIGMVIIRIITNESSQEEITTFLKEEHIGVTTMDAQGARGSVKMILSLVNRSDLPRIISHLKETNPTSFFSIEDVRYVNEGIFPARAQGSLGRFFRFAARDRKRD
jgi:uncharacterized protein YebE (UPF0316 family)